MVTHTNWEHRVRTGQVVLPQIEHLKSCIDYCNEDVTLIAPFNLWNVYENSVQGQLRLYAQQQWQHINEIISIINKQSSKWVYVAINRYLLLCDADSTVNSNYDQAIVDYVKTRLTNYTVVDYQYQTLNYTGNVGNFISPDNRLLCKKVS